MNCIFKTSIVSLATAIVLGMGGCSDSDPVVTDPAVTEVNSIGGKAIDGYLVYATVCLDLSNDGYCQIGDEPATSTDENGTFSLTLTAEQKAHSDYATAPLLVYGGYDKDTNTDFTGKLKATFNEEAEVNITPLTTMVEAMVASGEDEASAEAAVVAMLDLPAGTDLGADPIVTAKTDPALLRAALQLQKSLEILAEALESAGATQSQDDLLEGLYDSLATQLVANTDLDLDEALDAVVGADDKLTADALESATALTDQIKLIVGTSGTTDTAVVGTKIGAVQEEIIVNVINGTDSVTDLEFNAILTKDFSLLHAEEILRMVEFAGTPEEFDALALKVQSTFQVGGMSETEFLPIETEIALLKASADADVVAVGVAFEAKILGFESDATNLETLVEYDGAISALEDDVTALLETTKVATVADAKNTVAQIRESVNSFIDINIDSQEDNNATIVGSQMSLITTKIQPAADAIASDFNDSVVALEDSVTAFGDSLQTNFAAVFGAYNELTNVHTPGSIETRLDAINSAIGDKNETSNWSVVSSFGDTLEHTYIKNGTTVSETWTFNDTTLTTVWEDTEDGRVTSLTTSGAIAFSGTDYNLSITSLDFTNGRAVFKANGTFDGLNSSKMTLTALDISFDFNETETNKYSANMLDNIEATFDGTIVSDGRVLEGRLVISESVSGNNQMIGSYTGLSGEPAFEGTLTLDASLDDVKTIIDDSDSDSDWIDPDSLLMVTYDDGVKSFVASYSSEYDSSTQLVSYILHTQNDANLTCTSDSSSSWDGYSQTVSCVGGNVEAFYGDEKIITLTVNGAEYIVRSASNYWNGSVSNIYLSNGSIYSDGTSLYIDVYDGSAGYTEANITDISIRDAYTVAEMDADFSFSGSFTHGTKVIRATVDYQQLGDASDMIIMAENVAIEDGTNFVKLDGLAITAKKPTNENEHQYYSTFESYSIDYYGSDDEEDSFSDFTSVELNNLAVSIKDEDNKVLTFDADLTYTLSSISDYDVTFNGVYSYDDTVFTGVVDASGNMNTESIVFNVSGDVKASGFEPFSIAIAGSAMGETIDAYALYTRGSDYKLGLSLVSTYDENNYTNTTVFNLADSNGVMSTYTETYYRNSYSVTTASSDPSIVVETTCYVEDRLGNEVEIPCDEVDAYDDSSDIIILTDKDGTQLAEFGEATTGNNWEVSYSDGTSETLF